MLMAGDHEGEVGAQWQESEMRGWAHCKAGNPKAEIVEAGSSANEIENCSGGCEP
jgi:hypothetical protein